MKRIFLYLTIGWMCFIFYQGSRQLDESYSQSDVIVDKVMEMVEIIQETFKKKPALNETDQTVTPKPSNQVNGAVLEKEKIKKDVAYVIRKSAHFFEYGVLAALLVIDFYLAKQSKINMIVYSLFITLICAVGDEFYQSFIGRGSNVRDVIIDFSGGVVFIGIVLVGLQLQAMLQRKNNDRVSLIE